MTMQTKIDTTTSETFKANDVEDMTDTSKISPPPQAASLYRLSDPRAAVGFDKALRIPFSKVTKLNQIIVLCADAKGATTGELCQATGWQSILMPGARAGQLKRKDYKLNLSSVKSALRSRLGRAT